jgi:protein associated with RNAse G/E
MLCIYDQDHRPENYATYVRYIITEQCTVLALYFKFYLPFFAHILLQVWVNFYPLLIKMFFLW